MKTPYPVNAALSSVAIESPTRSQDHPTAIDSAGDFRWLKKQLQLEDGLGQNIKQTINAELLDHFQRNAPPSVLMINIILAASLVAVMWSWASPIELLAWWCVQTAVVVGNGVMYRFFQKREQCERQHSHRYWYSWFCVGVLLNGLSWGFATAYFYNPTAHLQSVFMILIAAGLSAGVTTVQSSLRVGFILFAVPALLFSGIAVLFLYGSEELTVALLLGLYCVAIVYIGFNNHNTIVETIRLKFEKDDLLAQVHSSEAYFRALIENATDWVLVVDAKATIVFQSPSSQSVTGYSQDELNGLCLYDFIHTEDVDVFRSTLQYLSKYPGVHTGGESRFRHRNGEWIVLEGNGRTLGKTPNLLVINARDVSDRHRMEGELRDAKVRAETANQAKTLFLANMSHEIRTPMHAILAMADVLRETRLDTQQTRYVDAFKEAGEHLLSLLNDLLDFSRIETGELKLANAPFHLPQFIESVFDLMWVQAKTKNLNLHYAVDKSVKPWHLGDPQRLRQIIVNLVNNAIKFTEDGRIEILLSQISPDYILVEVSDTGEGIPEDKLDLIFDSFQQADMGISDRHGGAGLGLAICKRLAEAMNGTISVVSQSGKGTTFSCKLKLPATDEPTDLLDQRERHSAMAAAKLPPSKILVADDSAMNRMVIEEFLRFTACELDFVTNGQEAVEKMFEGHYDLILMDLRMPVMDGISATQIIREYEKEQDKPGLPIIALTAGVSQEDKERALAAGCNDYLAKPVGKQELALTLVKFLQKNRVILPEGAVS